MSVTPYDGRVGILDRGPAFLIVIAATLIWAVVIAVSLVAAKLAWDVFVSIAIG